MRMKYHVEQKVGQAAEHVTREKLFRIRATMAMTAARGRPLPDKPVQAVSLAQLELGLVFLACVYGVQGELRGTKERDAFLDPVSPVDGRLYELAD